MTRALFIVAAGLGVFGLAQIHPQPHGGSGPLASVELQNKAVEVLRIRLAAHEHVPMHKVTPRVVVWLTDAYLRDTFADGTRPATCGPKLEKSSGCPHSGTRVRTSAITPLSFSRSYPGAPLEEPTCGDGQNEQSRIMTPVGGRAALPLTTSVTRLAAHRNGCRDGEVFAPEPNATGEMMFGFLQILSVLTVVLATVPALAHALDLPGKIRLTQDQYYATQRIYYLGFTFAGIAEPVGIIAVALLLFLMPRGIDFWLTFVALLGLIGMHVVYWLFTHPVNKFWVEGQELSRVGAGFFSFGSKGSKRRDRPVGWTELRDRWEYSHVMRAALSTTSLVALVIAVK